MYPILDFNCSDAVNPLPCSTVQEIIFQNVPSFKIAQFCNVAFNSGLNGSVFWLIAPLFCSRNVPLQSQLWLTVVPLFPQHGLTPTV